jgi:hypothetical protein
LSVAEEGEVAPAVAEDADASDVDETAETAVKE